MTDYSFQVFGRHSYTCLKNCRNNDALEIWFNIKNIAKVIAKYLEDSKNLVVDKKDVMAAIKVNRLLPVYQIFQDSGMIDFCDSLDLVIDYKGALTTNEGYKEDWDDLIDALSREDPVSLNYFLKLKHVDNSNFDDIEVRELKKNLEQILSSYINSWMSENIDEIEEAIEVESNERQQKLDIRNSKKDKLVRIGVKGYLVVGDYNKPLKFVDTVEETSEYGDRYYTILNNGDIVN